MMAPRTPPRAAAPLLLAAVLPRVLAAEASGVLTTYSGYVVDFYCYSLCEAGGVALDGSNVITGPEEHTLHCLRDVPQCRDGYYLADRTPDGDYGIKFTFDDASHQALLEFMESFPKGGGRDHEPFAVTAEGYHDGGDGVLRGATFAACFGGAAAGCDGACSGGCDVAMGRDVAFTITPGFLLVGHVVCMCLSWGCLLPLGVLWAHYMRQSEWKPGGRPAWFQGHRWLMSIGVFLQLLGFFFVLLWKKAAHFGLPHEILGLVVVLLGLLQPVNAQLRRLKAVGHPDHPGPLRRAWEVLHKGLGYTTVALGVGNAVYGPIHASSMRFSRWLPIAAGIWLSLSLGTLAVAAVVLQVRQLAREGGTKDLTTTSTGSDDA